MCSSILPSKSVGDIPDERRDSLSAIIPARLPPSSARVIPSNKLLLEIVYSTNTTKDASVLRPAQQVCRFPLSGTQDME